MHLSVSVVCEKIFQPEIKKDRGVHSVASGFFLLSITCHIFPPGISPQLFAEGLPEAGDWLGEYPR